MYVLLVKVRLVLPGALLRKRRLFLGTIYLIKSNIEYTPVSDYILTRSYFPVFLMKRAPTLLAKTLHALPALFFGLGLWYVVALIVQHTRGVPFPTPHECAASLFLFLSGEPFLGHTIYEHLSASCLRWMLGFGAAFFLGLLYAFAACFQPLFKKVSMPTVEVLQLIPGLAWVPVVILLFGLNQNAAVAIIFLTTFPILAVSAYMGFSNTDERYIRAGLMCGYGAWGLLKTVYLPSALPHLLSGTRIGLGASWRVLVAAEMVIGSGSGLGYSVIQSRWTMDYVSAFACIMIIALIGLALERLILLPVERRTLRRWGMPHER